MKPVLLRLSNHLGIFYCLSHGVSTLGLGFAAVFSLSEDQIQSMMSWNRSVGRKFSLESVLGNCDKIGHCLLGQSLIDLTIRFLVNVLSALLLP